MALALVRGDGPLMAHAVRSKTVGVVLAMIRFAQPVSPDEVKRFTKWQQAGRNISAVPDGAAFPYGP